MSGGNPRPVKPGTDPALQGVDCGRPGGLVESLGGTADSMRQLLTDAGLRPYRVFSVVVRWSGGAPGRGDVQVVSEQELLPRPLVVDMGGVRGASTAAGKEERGGVMLRQVSPRYTEDDLRALFHQQPLPQGHEGFLEVRMDGRDGVAERRRFVVRDVPHRDAGKFEWRVKLAKQSADRTRAGALRDDTVNAVELQMSKFGG